MSNYEMVHSINKALDIMELLGGAARCLPVQLISSTLAMPRSTTHNILRTLTHRGYLERLSKPIRYRLGKSVKALPRLDCERDLFVRAMPLLGRDPTAFGRNRDINLVEISQWESPVHARIYVGRYPEAKLQASQAHASQFSGGPGWATAIPSALRKRVLDYDRFTRAWPPPSGALENDLFSGVV